MRPFDISVAAPVGDLLGEAPSWSAETQTLVWVDIEGRRLHARGPGGTVRTTSSPDRPAAVVASAGGGYLLAAEHAFWLLDAAGERRELLADISDREQPGSRLNDGKCDPSGRFWAGTVTPRTRGGASVYRLDLDGTLHVGLSGVTVTNGLGWSPAGTTMYFADSPLRTIDAIDFHPETGALGARRVLADVRDCAGVPDGLSVDADGGLWVAFFGGGALRRYTAQGQLDLVVPLPVRNPTSCAFGGPDLTDLFVTTARWDPRDHPPDEGSGHLLHLRPGVAGCPTAGFGLPGSALGPGM